MDDLISRQDAINLLKKWSDGYDYIETETESAIKDFQNLPSAQKWIPVSERLPEENGRYLVSGGIKSNRQIWICEFVMIANVRGWINDVSNPMVTVWMPLPEPYKEKDDG